MLTMATEKRAITEKDALVEFDERWVLLYKRAFPPSEDKGYIVAYGDGTPEDRDALRALNFEKYKGEAHLLKGYVPKDGIYECGPISAV
ncbi:hypothetical protein R80B4_01359 [Fibrobacteres bacterium R8-0-B4]